MQKNLKSNYIKRFFNNKEDIHTLILIFYNRRNKSVLVCYVCGSLDFF